MSERDFVVGLRRASTASPDAVEFLLWKLLRAGLWRKCAFILQFYTPSPDDPWTLRITAAIAAAVLNKRSLKEGWFEGVCSELHSTYLPLSSTFVGESASRAKIIFFSWVAFLSDFSDAAREPTVIRSQLVAAYAQEHRSPRDSRGIAEILHGAAMLGRLVRCQQEKWPVGHLRVPETVETLLPRLVASRSEFTLGAEEACHTILLGILKVAWMVRELIGPVAGTLLKWIKQGGLLGHLLEPVWHFLSRLGYHQEVLGYAEGFIGTQGKAWAWRASSRREIVTKLCDLLEQAAERKRADEARNRLLVGDVGYLENKDTSLSQPLQWFQEYAKHVPHAWRVEGLELWSRSTLAQDSGDNRLYWDVKEAVFDAACRDSPDALQSIALSCDRILEEDSREIVRAIASAIPQLSLSGKDYLAIWAFCIGYCSWRFEEDRNAIATLRESLLV